MTTEDRTARGAARRGARSPGLVHRRRRSADPRGGPVGGGPPLRARLPCAGRRLTPGRVDRAEADASQGDDVAMVAGDLHLPGVDGVDFLERAHAMHPDSWRVLLVVMDRHHTTVPFTELATLQHPCDAADATTTFRGLRRQPSLRKSRLAHRPGGRF